MLAKKIESLPFTVFGSCTRDDNGKIDVDFQVTDVDKRAQVAKCIQDAFAVSKSCLTTTDLEVRLGETWVVSDSLRHGWKYVPRADSPGDQKYTPLRGVQELAVGASPKKARSTSDDSSSIGSSGQQNAHILFAQKHSSELSKLVQAVLQQDGMLTDDKKENMRTVNAVLDPLLKITHPFDYTTHQNYDNLLYFYAWKFQKCVGEERWNLVTQLRFPHTEPGMRPALLNVSQLVESAKISWGRALALRKALTSSAVLGQYSLDDLVEDWKADKSTCWDTR